MAKRFIAKVLLFFVFLLCCSVAVTQDFVQSKKYNKLINKGFKESYIVRANGDTLHGLARFKFITEGTFWFYDENGIKAYLYPHDITTIKYDNLLLYSFEGSLFRMIYEGRSVDLIQKLSIENLNLGYDDDLDLAVINAGMSAAGNYAVGSPDPLIGLLLIGNLVLPFLPESTPFWLRDKDSIEPIYLNNRIFTKNYPEIFKGCDKLIKNIVDGVFDYADIQKVVEEYDNCSI